MSFWCSIFSQTLNRLQEIDDGCYSLFLKAASTCLDNDKNIKSENLNDVADLVNSSYSEAGLTAFGVKMIWVEFKEYWKAWNEAIKVVDQDIVDWQSGTIKPKDERDWEMILRAVPEAVAFKSKKLFLASEIHSIFTRSNVQDFEDLKHDMSINCPSTSHMP